MSGTITGVGAKRRVDMLAPEINRVVSIARENGIQIIHSPSDTIDFYEDTIYGRES